jgi:chemotaxis protein CheD
MRAASEYLEYFLQPGEFQFSDDPDVRLRTLLGSCVAITMWHPRRRYGAMCHYMLPTRGARRTGELDGRFGDEAYLMFLREAVRHGTDPNEYEIKVFGGGDMFPTVAKAGRLGIGKQNVVAGIELLALHGQPIKARHVGGEGHRVVMFDLWDGNVWVKHQPQVAAR